MPEGTPAKQFSKPEAPPATPENEARYEQLVATADREVQRGRAAFYTAAKAMQELRNSRLDLLAYRNWTEPRSTEIVEGRQ